tara:strand:- start:2078 stop:2464 length:387 start_codon:yes stop_codon:yes gene_type:complete
VLSYKKLHLNQKSTVDLIDGLDDEIFLIFDDNCVLEVENEEIQKNLIENYKPEKIYLYAKSLTNALKKVDSDGYVVENLDRGQYVEVYTPLICQSEYIESYFKKYQYWSLDRFVELNEDKIEFYLSNL